MDIFSPGSEYLWHPPAVPPTEKLGHVCGRRQRTGHLPGALKWNLCWAVKKSRYKVGRIYANVSRETEDGRAGPMTPKEHRVGGKSGPATVDARSARRSDDWNPLQDGSLSIRGKAGPWPCTFGATTVPNCGAAGRCTQPRATLPSGECWVFQKREYWWSPILPSVGVGQYRKFASGTSRWTGNVMMLQPGTAGLP